MDSVCTVRHIFSQNNLAVFQGGFGAEVGEMVEEKTVCQILSSGGEKITPIKTGCVVLRPQDITILRIIKVPPRQKNQYGAQLGFPQSA
jgi:hypothetical protein